MPGIRIHPTTNNKFLVSHVPNTPTPLNSFFLKEKKNYKVTFLTLYINMLTFTKTNQNADLFVDLADRYIDSCRY
jgi:hypothetical protein